MINTKLKKQICAIFLAISFVIGSIFFLVPKSADSYNIMQFGLEYYNDEFVLGNMRPLQYVIDLLIIKGFGNVSYNILYLIFLSISLILTGISMYLVFNHLNKLISSKDKIKEKKIKIGLIFFCVVFMFFNMYFSDNLLYLENLTMTLSLFLTVIASIIYSKNIKGKTIISLILLTIAEFNYQTMIMPFVVLSMLFYAVEKEEKINIKFMLKISIITLIPMLLLFGTSKIFEINNITVNVRRIESLEEFYSSIFLIVGQIIVYLVIYKIVDLAICSVMKKSKEVKDNVSVNMNVIIFNTVLYNFAFALINKGFLSNRMAWCIGALASIICIYRLLYAENIYKEKRLIYAIISLIFITEISFYAYFAYINFKYNKITLNNVEYVMNYITKYNEKNEINIENIALYSDKEITNEAWSIIVPYLDFNIYNGNDTFDVQLCLFGDPTLLFEDKNEEIEEYFKSNDWNEFSEEQFIVEDNTLHFCMY